MKRHEEEVVKRNTIRRIRNFDGGVLNKKIKEVWQGYATKIGK